MGHKVFYAICTLCLVTEGYSQSTEKKQQQSPARDLANMFYNDTLAPTPAPTKKNPTVIKRPQRRVGLKYRILVLTKDPRTEDCELHEVDPFTYMFRSGDKIRFQFESNEIGR